jgi:hypothetical protein
MAINGNHCKSVVALAEALIILSLNSVPSFKAWFSFLRVQRASISAEIGKRVFEALFHWLTSATDTKNNPTSRLRRLYCQGHRLCQGFLRIQTLMETAKTINVRQQ